MEEKETISGTISDLVFQNSEKWSVFKLEGGQSCTGTLADICSIGTDVECVGTFVDSKFGKQFKCVQIIPILPDITTDNGVIKLLQRLPGIGPKKARVAVDEHGAQEAWTLAQADPGLIGVSLASCDKAMDIARNLIGNFEALNYLLGIGLTDNQAQLIIDRFGDSAIKVVSEDPYSLIGNIEGFAFLTVDKIALKSGVGVGARSRVNACILHCLLDSELNGGHVYLWGRDLCGIVISNLVESAKKAEVPLEGLPVYQDVRNAVYWLEDEGAVVIKKGMVFHCYLLAAEKCIESVVTNSSRAGEDEEF